MERTVKDIGIVLAALVLVVFFLNIPTSPNAPPKDSVTILNASQSQNEDEWLHFTIPKYADHWRLWWWYTCYGASFWLNISSGGFPAAHRNTVYISEIGSGGSGVKQYSGAGYYFVDVTTGNSCSWTLKVTVNGRP